MYIFFVFGAEASKRRFFPISNQMNLHLRFPGIYKYLYVAVMNENSKMNIYPSSNGIWVRWRKSSSPTIQKKVALPLHHRSGKRVWYFFSDKCSYLSILSKSYWNPFTKHDLFHLFLLFFSPVFLVPFSTFRPSFIFQPTWPGFSFRKKVLIGQSLHCWILMTGPIREFHLVTTTILGEK